MPVTSNRPASVPPTGTPVRPTVTQTSAQRTTVMMTLGQREADRAWNGDGLHLSAEAQLATGTSGIERVRLRAGIEGIEAKIGLVKDGQARPRFEGISLRDGALKGELRDTGDYLLANPVVGAAAVVGTVVVAQQIARATGDDIKIDTGKVRLYRSEGFTASVVGEIAITGDKDWIRGQGAKLRLDYDDSEYGAMSLEAGYDRNSRAKVTAGWSKTLDGGLQASANAFYEEKTRNAGVSVGLNYRF